MKLRNLILAASLAVIATGCQKEDYSWIKTGIERAQHQLMLTASEIDGTGTLPRSIWVGYDFAKLNEQLEKEILIDSLRPQPAAEKIGTRRLCSIYDWTSGFFPGSLWYIYEFTNDEAVKAEAIKFTELLNPVREYTGTHDLGFMMNCSYGNALRLSPNDTIPAVLIQTAENLCSRFDAGIGCIRSWDFGHWNFPVIIDNMMNLDLLFSASKLSGNPYYKEIAIKHANTTMPNHFRPDYTSWHVVSYNSDGTVECKETFQGKNHDSAWSRGQAWGLYGYTATYRETGDKTYLEFAQNIADMFIARTTTEDAIPYWDFDAPALADTPRDASAAAVAACGLLELSTFAENGEVYFNHAEKILKSLSSEAYLAAPGENQGFVLMHSTGSLAHGSEIDVPLNYADYYYLEGLQRYMNLKGIEYKNL